MQLVRDLRSGLARFPQRLAPVVAGALSDLTVQRHLRYLRYLDDLQAEREHLRELPELVQRDALGGRILQELAIAQGLANEGAGELVRQRFRRAVEELRDLDNQATAVAIELLSARRADLQNEQNGQTPRAHAPSRRNVWAVDTMEDGAVWPYTGEVWEDEVGNYRQNVDDRCGR